MVLSIWTTHIHSILRKGFFMRVQPARASMAARMQHGRSAAPVALFVTAVLVAVMPAGSAAASPTHLSPAATPSAEVSGLRSSQVQELLGGVPLEDLSATQLSEVLAQFPGFGDLGSVQPAQLQEALAAAIESLAGKGDTLGQLGDPAELVSGLLTRLRGLLSPTELLELEGLEIPLLLEGKSLGTRLTGALGSPGSTELADDLLNSASSPGQFVEELLAAVDPAKLEALLGAMPTGEPVTETTVGKLASSLGTTEEALVSSLNSTSAELPATAMALIAPLANGKALGVLDGVKELSLATLPTSGESGSGGAGGTGGAGGGSGSPGAPSGAGMSNTPASTTVVFNYPSSEAADGSSAGAEAAAKIRIVSDRVHGNTVTLVVQVPAAGRLTLRGKGVKSVSEQTSTTEHVTVRTVLTKAGIAARHKHRHGIGVELKVAFKPVHGASSAVAARVKFA
jgi:hypothetical protein